MGEAFELPAANLTSDEAFDALVSDLVKRFSDLGVNTDRPDCGLNLTRYESSGILGSLDQRDNSNETITVALNLYNSQDILPSLSIALMRIVHVLQPTHKIYISIFENDSDDHTREMLGDLAAALLSQQIDGVIFRSSVLHRPEDLERIVGLANIRNEALLPLMLLAQDGILLFVNDVICCAQDLFELLHQLRLQHAHGAMSTDWEASWESGSPQGRFRDTWVARGINGELPYPMSAPDGFTIFSPNQNWETDLWITQNDTMHQRWLDGRPMPMYSGWNGAIAFDATLFTRYHVRFRASGKAAWEGGDASGRMGRWGELMATPGYLESDCASSECKLLARDIWNLLDGQARFVLAPQSRTTYNMDDWRVVSKQCPPTIRTDGEGLEEELIDWSDVSIPDEVVCVPNLDGDAREIDPWSEGNMRQRFSQSPCSILVVKVLLLTMVTEPRFEGYKPA